MARCAWIFAAPLRSPDPPLRFAQDDFYYYLKPAQNLAWFHRSTFDGTTPTNGYHPLYFVLLTAASLFIHTLPGIFRFLWVLDTVSAAAIFLLTRRIFASLTSRLIANALAVGITVLCVPMLCDQMEVTLALPLGFAFLLAGFVTGPEITPRRAALMGLLGALTFLARLDAGLMIALYVAAALCTREYHQAFTPRNVASFLAACLPLPLLYLWLNVHYFGTLLPVSGMAKQLRHNVRPSILLPASFNGTSELLLNVAIVAGVFAWALRASLRPREKLFLFSVLATPFLFYGLEMFVSDWPVWNWYFYDLRFAAAGAALLLAVLVSRDVLGSGYARLDSMLAGKPFALTLLGLTLLVLLKTHFKVDDVMTNIAESAATLDGFEQHHPGKYAMGDRAGMFAITVPSSVLQTEGLAMDRTYLQNIRASHDLRAVLSQYGVQYYIAFVFIKNEKMQFSGSCFHAMEPSIPGPDALRMRSDFCQAPAFRFTARDGEYVIYQIDAI